MVLGSLIGLGIGMAGGISVSVTTVETFTAVHYFLAASLCSAKVLKT